MPRWRVSGLLPAATAGAALAALPRSLCLSGAALEVTAAAVAGGADGRNASQDALEGWCAKGQRRNEICCDATCRACGGLSCSGACCGEYLRRQGRVCVDGNDVSCLLPEDGREKPYKAHELVVTGTGAWRHSGPNAYPEDQGFAAAIARFLVRVGARDVIDVGSGSGALARLVAAKANVSVLGVDGNTNTAEASAPHTFVGGGRVAFRWVDLALPFPADLERFDWAMSIAVAEHVPFQFEHILLANLFRASRLGLILMWGARWMPGVGHVNCRDEPEVLNIFGKLGYAADTTATWALRRRARLYWNKHVVVLRRVSQPLTGAGGTPEEMPSLHTLAKIAMAEHERACWGSAMWSSQRTECCSTGGLGNSKIDEVGVYFSEGTFEEDDRHSCFGAGFNSRACCATPESYHFP